MTVIDIQGELIKATLIYVKTNIGGFFFDAFLRLDHTSNLQITEHPVQTGSAITDHSYLKPKEVVIEIGMSDCLKDIIPGQFTGGWSRSTTAYKVLRELQSQRIPMDVLTRLGLYKNMIIETISAPDDYQTLNSLKATITMRELIVATVQTVRISDQPQTTDRTNRGNVNVKQIPDSMLLQAGMQIGSMIGG